MNMKESHSSAAYTQGTLFVISAPSGAGKTSLANKIVESMADVERSISHTTRPIRPGEIEGVHYHFVEKSEFEKMLFAGDFLEHAEIFDYLYGTSHHEIRHRLGAGIDILLTIDWQGARQVCRLFPDAISIFILPPSLTALENRLTHRKQDEDDIIQKRLENVPKEVVHYDEFDYLIVNDVFEEAFQDLQAIIRSNRLKRVPQALSHAGLLAELLKTR